MHLRVFIITQQKDHFILWCGNTTRSWLYFFESVERGVERHTLNSWYILMILLCATACLVLVANFSTWSVGMIRLWLRINQLISSSGQMKLIMLSEWVNQELSKCMQKRPFWSLNRISKVSMKIKRLENDLNTKVEDKKPYFLLIFYCMTLPWYIFHYIKQYVKEH